MKERILYVEAAKCEWINEDGWYFVDEAEQLQGPFKSSHLAEQAMECYL